MLELKAAERLKKKRGRKKKNEHPITTINRVQRLTVAMSGHYRAALERFLRADDLLIDWPARGL